MSNPSRSRVRFVRTGNIGNPGWDSGSRGGPLGAARTIVLGARPDLPDLRDYLLGPGTKPSNTLAAPFLRYQKQDNSISLAILGKAKAASLPPDKDLRDTGYFSPVEDQQDIGSCTAQAVTGMVEYLVRKAQSPPLDLSRMFLYKCTRRISGDVGDSGASIRDTIKALALFGAPPETFWPYGRHLLDAEPEAFHYAFADNFKATVYARLDSRPQGQDFRKTLENIKRALVDGFPAAFGFSVYSSIYDMGQNGIPKDLIPFPDLNRDQVLGGHAVLVVGYDDNHDAGMVEGKPSKGALLMRNSWGGEWGDGGYGWLPYAYVEYGLARDFWVVLNEKWFDL